MKKTKYLIIIIFLGVISIGLFVLQKKNNDSGMTSDWDLNNTREIYQDDDALINSQILAQKNLSRFISEFKTRNREKDEFYVKIRFTENGQAEHMWVNILELSDDLSIGLLDNDPLKFKKLKYLDTVEFDINKAEDLMLYKGDSLVLGGFLWSESQKK